MCMTQSIHTHTHICCLYVPGHACSRGDALAALLAPPTDSDVMNSTPTSAASRGGGTSMTSRQRGVYAAAAELLASTQGSPKLSARLRYTNGNGSPGDSPRGGSFMGNGSPGSLRRSSTALGCAAAWPMADGDTTPRTSDQSVGI